MDCPARRIWSWLRRERENHSLLAIPRWLLQALLFGKQDFSSLISLTATSALYSFYWLRRWSSSLKLSYGEEHIPFPGSSVGSAFLFCFFLPGIFVGVSRTQDYRHHASDVIVGGLIGTFITTVVFLQYYSFQPRKTRKTFPNSETQANHSGSSSL